MQKGVKFRIYPNREQQNIINQTLGCCRLIYNKGLAMRNEAYQNGNKIGYSQTSKMLTDLKKSDDFAFLKAVDSIALQQSLRDLDRGFVNFFQKRASHPTFKSKHNHHQSYRTINQGDNIRIVGKYIKLPKLGYVKVRQSMTVGKINNVTIEHTPTNKYFAVLNVKFEPQPMSNKGGKMGIDVGIKASKVLRNEYPTMKTRKPSLWTNRYFASTVGGAPLDVLKQYIENQKTSQRPKDKLGYCKKVLNLESIRIRNSKLSSIRL